MTDNTQLTTQPGDIDFQHDADPAAAVRADLDEPADFAAAETSTASGAGRCDRAGGARVVASLDTLTREPQPLMWADSGEPVGATLQLIPPYERRVSRTPRGETVTGIRVSCADDCGRRVHVDLAAAQTRMASVWDDRDTAPIALLQYLPDNDTRDGPRANQPADGEDAVRDPAVSGHVGTVAVTTEPFDYFHRRDIETDRYPNLETALLTLITSLHR